MWVARGILYAPDEALARGQRHVNPEPLSAPHVQLDMMRALISARLVDLVAQARGMTASPEEISAHLEADPKLSRFKPNGVQLADGRVLPATLGDFGLSMEVLQTHARQELLSRKLTEALLQSMTTEQLWELWQRRHDLASALIVEISNTPSSQEIDDFVALQGPRVEAHFREHQSRYQPAPQVILTLLRLPPEQPLDDDARARLARGRALLEASSAQGQPPTSDQARALGLTLEPAQALVRQEDPAAFAAPVGQAGLSLGRPPGSYAWLVERKPPAPPATLSPAVRREIAAELLRIGQPSQAALATFERARALLRGLKRDASGKAQPASLRQIVQALGALDARVHLLQEPFARDPEGFIPKVGLASPLSDALFTMTLGPGALLEAPVLSRQTLYAGALLDRRRPDRAAFEAALPTWREDTIKAQRPYILDEYLASLAQRRGVTMNLHPLKARYGHLRKATPTPPPPSEPPAKTPSRP